jgi:hypothetical protein
MEFCKIGPRSEDYVVLEAPEFQPDRHGSGDGANSSELCIKVSILPITSGRNLWTKLIRGRLFSEKFANFLLT